ncbi:MAG TPA: class I lanthipeptide [Candidatus Deferrimicrobium sp.]|nr:class I lanthipeptide [Patescibacteria group bacterium]HLP60080.1 class I lanthipeptide [Candidatus Deferrimicrobium sp.]
MKTKKFEKKLVLSKTTVANLENEELLAIKGGTGTKLYDCESIPILRCTNRC